MNNILLKHEPKKRIAQQCLDAHLYVNGWLLKHHLETLSLFNDKNWKELNTQPFDIVAAFNSGEPVGVILLSDFRFNTFIKPSFRRKGIGTLLYNKLIEITKRDYKNIQMDLGSKGSEDFFKSIGQKYYKESLESIHGPEFNDPPAFTKW